MTNDKIVYQYIKSNPSCRNNNLMSDLFKDDVFGYYRKLDYSLQRLRKAKKIVYENGWQIL